MYTLTVKIAEAGTEYIKPNTGETTTSPAGHMWYSLSDENGPTVSFGFAPIVSGVSKPGYITQDDDTGYQSRYYTGSIVINQNVYDDLMSWGELHPGFDMDYLIGWNDCIDFTWEALEKGGFNPGGKDGDFWPAFNADEVDRVLYKSYFGSTTEWDQSKADDGNYHVIYGSPEIDIITSLAETDAIYGGGGNDIIYLSKETIEKLRPEIVFDGGNGEDTIQGSENNDSLDLTNVNLTSIELVEMGVGNDVVKASQSADGPETYKGGADNDTVDGREAGRSLKLYGDEDEDMLYGSKYDDYLEGGKGRDTMKGGSGNDTFFIKGTDSDYDIFNGGLGVEDKIQGSTGDDTIRLHDFQGENTVEIINGGKTFLFCEIRRMAA